MFLEEESKPLFQSKVHIHCVVTEARLGGRCTPVTSAHRWVRRIWWGGRPEATLELRTPGWSELPSDDWAVQDKHLEPASCGQNCSLSACAGQVVLVGFRRLWGPAMPLEAAEFPELNTHFAGSSMQSVGRSRFADTLAFEFEVSTAHPGSDFDKIPQDNSFESCMPDPSDSAPEFGTLCHNEAIQAAGNSKPSLPDSSLDFASHSILLDPKNLEELGSLEPRVGSGHSICAGNRSVRALVPPGRRCSAAFWTCLRTLLC